MPDDVAEFNLLDEPFIPVLRRDGRATTVSLMGLFAEAAELDRITAELPTQSFSLVRLALAVAHRAFVSLTPAYDEDVRDVVDDLAERWPQAVEEQVRPYLETHRARFDLFDPELPFFQTAGLHTAKGDVSELGKIVADVPNGSPYLTARSARSLRRIPAAEAALWLIHTQAYDPSGIKTGVVGHPRAKGGKVYPEGTGWTGQLGGVHLLGASVRDTLLLNLWAARPAADRMDVDLPPWERPAQTLASAPDFAYRPVGPVDLYTWQPRRIRLVRAPGTTDVTGVLLTYGDKFTVQERQNLIGLEPMSTWRYSKPQTAKFGRTIHMTRK
ncbi:MAG: type I-E CRISPR-associated protein Cse1/CasA, partial [Actinobacteria bacterium]|nr:type I-E CRISPR-associated protein Cse1/CasA [Actinomycetota bacterium]